MNIISEYEKWGEHNNIKFNIYSYNSTLAYETKLGKKAYWTTKLGLSGFQSSQYDSSYYFAPTYTGETWHYASVSKTVSKLENLSFNSTVEFFAAKGHTLKGGVEGNYFVLHPGELHLKEGAEIQEDIIDTITGTEDINRAIDLAAFIEDEWHLSDKMVLNAGFRFTAYKADSLKFRMDIEPRISLNYMFNDNWSFKLSYSKMHQYIHEVQKLNDLLSFDQFVLSTQHYSPIISHQISTGVFTHIYGLDAGVEVFYKKMAGLLYYGFVDLQDNTVPKWTDGLYSNGQGTAKGMELQVEKKMDKFILRCYYTLMKSTRQFEDYNNGIAFIAPYERTHNLNLQANYIFSEKISSGMNFNFHSGTPATVPIAKVAASPFMPAYYAYNGINNYRLPAYHRLDVYLRREWIRNDKNFSFTFNIYNIYAKKNADIIYMTSAAQLHGKVNFLIIPTFDLKIEY